MSTAQLTMTSYSVITLYLMTVTQSAMIKTNVYEFNLIADHFFADAV